MLLLKELIAARSNLNTEIAKAHKAESEGALNQVHELVAEFGFPAQQVLPWRPTYAKVAAKYRDGKIRRDLDLPQPAAGLDRLQGPRRPSDLPTYGACIDWPVRRGNGRCGRPQAVLAPTGN